MDSGKGLGDAFQARAATATQRSPQAGSGKAGITIAEADLRYLTRLADWAAGQGFCQIEGIEDPEEWCYRTWTELGPANGDGYSADALADAVVRRHLAGDAG